MVADPSIPRREAIQRLAILLGGTLSLPAQAALLGQKINTEPVDLPADQQALIASLAEVIIPATDTPGAKEAGVGSFIVRVIRDCTGKDQQTKFLEGLQKTNVLSQKAFSKPFVELSSLQQTEVVGQLAREEKEIFLSLRELTIVGYFTSELGATKALEYLPVPGRFQGDLPLKPGQRVWAI